MPTDGAFMSAYLEGALKDHEKEMRRIVGIASSEITSLQSKVKDLSSRETHAHNTTALENKNKTLKVRIAYLENQDAKLSTENVVLKEKVNKLEEKNLDIVAANAALQEKIDKMEHAAREAEERLEAPRKKKTEPQAGWFGWTAR